MHHIRLQRARRRQPQRPSGAAVVADAHAGARAPYQPPSLSRHPINPPLISSPAAPQIIMQLENRGLTHYIALADSPDLCEHLHQRWPLPEDSPIQPSCAYSSEPYKTHNASYHQGDIADLWSTRYFTLAKIGAHPSGKSLRTESSPGGSPAEPLLASPQPSAAWT